VSKDGGHPIRVAAAGDVHAEERLRSRLGEAFERVAHEADLVLLAGDLTTHGRPEEAQVLGDVCRDLDVPVYAVLGNHDWHSNRADEVRATVEDAGMNVLERSSAVVEIRGTRVGIAGTKGFVGGFPGSAIPDFGEPLLREVYAETTDEVNALGRALDEIRDCPFRIVLLHYSPALDTIRGEPEGIWAFLGSNRLAVPISEHLPDVVLHGHAHEGCFEGSIGTVPVYNVAVHVTGRDFYVFDLEPGEKRAAIEVE
jgi:uncharacterized protein